MASPRTPLHRRLIVLTGVLVAGALLLEGVLRVRQWRKYGIAAPSFYELQEDPATGLRIPKPGSRVGPISIDSRGFRGPELELPKPPGRLRLAFLGGSTTFCAEASSFEATWPERVRAGLAAAHPGLSVDAVNAAGPGWSTRESLTNLVHRVAPLAPDVVVIYHATNDLTRDAQARAIAAGLAEKDAGGTSWLARVSLAWNLLEKNLRYHARQRDTGSRTLDVDVGALAEDFRTRLDALVSSARDHGAKLVVLVTFSHRARRDQAPEELREASGSSRYYMPYLSVETILDGFDAYNRVIREEARRLGTVLVEGEDTIPGDAAHFADSVHFTDAGCALQAERVLRALEASPRFRRILEVPQHGR